MSYKYDDIMRLTIGDIAGVLYATQISYDRLSNELTFLSFVGYKSMIDEVSKIIKAQNQTVIVRAPGCSCYKDKTYRYQMDVAKNPNTDVYHATITIKDNYKTLESGERWTIYLFVNEQDPNKEQRLKELLLDKLNKYSSIPILPEWIDYIYNACRDDIRLMNTSVLERTNEIEIYKLNGDQDYIKNIISTGLKNRDININGSNEPSIMLEPNTGLNDYLSLFGSLLADKIQNRFRPKFVPGQDKYSNYLMTLDDYIHHKGIELYAAQMAVIQATANNFNKNSYGFIVGEMGAGIKRF